MPCSLARTDPDAEKHAGLTAFVIDMHAPGVEVRPLRQMNGGADFSEVFISDVRIPDSERLGDVGTGWAVSAPHAGAGALQHAAYPQPRRGPDQRGDARRGSNAGTRRRTRRVRSKTVSCSTGSRPKCCACSKPEPAPCALAGGSGPEGSLGKLAPRSSAGRLAEFALVAARPGRVADRRLRERRVDDAARRAPRRGRHAITRSFVGSPGMAIVAAPTRSSATSSATGCSACPASRASTAACPGARPRGTRTCTTHDHDIGGNAMSKPLEGIRVVEVAMWAFVPSAGGILADWGAEVIKIEAPTGDPIRGLGVRWRGQDRRHHLHVGALQPGQARHRARPQRGDCPEDRVPARRDRRRVPHELCCRVWKKLKIDHDDIRAGQPADHLRGRVGPGRARTRGREGRLRLDQLLVVWLGVVVGHAQGSPPIGMPAGAFGDSLSGMGLAGGIAAALAHKAKTGRVGSSTVRCSAPRCGRCRWGSSAPRWRASTRCRRAIARRSRIRS